MSRQAKECWRAWQTRQENGQKVWVSLQQAVDKLRKRSAEGRQEAQASVLLVDGRFGIREETRECRFKGEGGSLRGQLRTNRRSTIVQCCLNRGALLVSTCRCGWGLVCVQASAAAGWACGVAVPLHSAAAAV